MKVKILGCSGAEFPGHPLSSILINDSLLIDAGSVTSNLTLEEQVKIKNILISHAHLDHIKDIGFLGDNVMSMTKNTINIISKKDIISVIKKYLLNDVIWPDFTSISVDGLPVLRYIEIKTDEEIVIDDITFKAINVNHSVDAVGFVIKDMNSSMLYSGDTGPTDSIWNEINKDPNMKGILIETSFPNNMSNLAETSCHLTPKSLKKELKKLLNPNIPIYLYHLKPQYRDIIKKEIEEIKDYNINILNKGDLFEF